MFNWLKRSPPNPATKPPLVDWRDYYRKKILISFPVYDPWISSNPVGTGYRETMVLATTRLKDGTLLVKMDGYGWKRASWFNNWTVEQVLDDGGNQIPT